MAASGDDRRWLLLHFATTTLWLPTTESDDVVVQTTNLRPAGRAEGHEWEAEAILPGHRWRRARPSGDPVRAGDRVFRIDRDVALVRPDVDDAQRPPEEVLARLGELSHYFGIHEDVPGKATLTENHEGHRLGLHLDNWDRLPAAARHTSRNRVNLNLGPERRWFLFDVVAAHPPDVVPNTVSVRQLVRRAAMRPTLVRLQVPAGWAYIAPTENLVHDASSDGQRRGTRHASALGRFTPL